MSSHGAVVQAQHPTRNQHHQALVIQARTARLQTTVRLARLDALEHFIALATINPLIGNAIQVLTIALPLRNGYPAQIIRDSLGLTPNVDTLVLILPDSSPATVLNGVILPRLRVFSTNLPHRVLPLFLSLHPLITGLSLEACGSRAECSLRDLNLVRVSDLRCPARCLEGIARGQVEVATVNLTRLASMAALALQSLSTSPLYSLSVEFFSDDYDILSRIVSAAPTLRKLKLVEKPRTQRRFHHARRPWNDLQEWHRLLLRLPFLEELMLRTTASVTGPQRPEHDVVLSWANGTRRRGGVHHPNLYHIGISQQSSAANAQLQALSHWFRQNGTWERVSALVVDATHSFVVM